MSPQPEDNPLDAFLAAWPSPCSDGGVYGSEHYDDPGSMWPGSLAYAPALFKSLVRCGGGSDALCTICAPYATDGRMFVHHPALRAALKAGLGWAILQMKLFNNKLFLVCQFIARFDWTIH